MAKAGGIRLRGILRTVHLWIGLTLFVVLAPLGLSGSLLVWDDGLDKLGLWDRPPGGGPGGGDPFAANLRKLMTAPATARSGAL